MKKLAIAALAAALAPTLACAEVWTVSEGPGARVKGSWNVTVTGDDISGAATMGGIDGRTLTYGLTGKMKDGTFVIHRVKPSDQTDCVYVGKPESKTITGSAMCKGAGSPWTVTRGS
jgi:hypothetical protein